MPVALMGFPLLKHRVLCPSRPTRAAQRTSEDATDTVTPDSAVVCRLSAVYPSGRRACRLSSAPLREAALVPLSGLRSPTLAGPSSLKLHLPRTMIRLHHVMPDPCAGKQLWDLRPAGRLDEPAIPIRLLAKAETTAFREDRRPGRRAPRARRQADPPLASGKSPHTRGLLPADVPLLPMHDSNRSRSAGCPATRIPTRTLVVRGAPHPRPHRCGIRLLAP